MSIGVKLRHKKNLHVLREGCHEGDRDRKIHGEKDREGGREGYREKGTVRERGTGTEREQ